eukprot:8642540-Pyramimonas_sp.AAC.1
MFFLSMKLDSSEKRQLNSGTALIDFRAHAGRRIDQMSARFEIRSTLRGRDRKPQYPQFPDPTSHPVESSGCGYVAYTTT